MQLTWSYLLAQYGKARGGIFFGGDGDKFDGQLVLDRGDKSPLLVLLRQVGSGRYVNDHLTARTSVRLNGEYKLDIRPRGLTGSGYQAIMGLAGQSRDYGCPEATQCRIIASNDQALTRQVLGSLELRLALERQTGEQLRVCPDVRGEGWHLVEVDRKDFDSGLKDGPWPRDAILNDSPYHTDADRAVLFRAAQAQFDEAMNGFLDLLTAAGDALAAWSGVISGR